MSVEKFLSFWSQNNVLIIECLLAAVILLSLLIAFRSFFGKKHEASGEHSAGGVDTGQLEKTLQKILENQAAQGMAPAATKVEASKPVAEAPAAVATAPADNEAAEKALAEVAELKKSLAESKKEVSTLQDKIQEVTAASQAPAAPAEAAVSAANAGNTSELMDKIRDLEARLAEYEIISEDIADLSKYREENDTLKKEIDSLRVQAGGAPSQTVVAEASSEAAPAVTAESKLRDSLAEDPNLATKESSLTTPAADEVPTADASVPVSSGSGDVVDDELMKEFAAAVEGQKAGALETAAEKAGDGKAAVKTAVDDTNSLMNDFENFVNKKS